MAVFKRHHTKRYVHSNQLHTTETEPRGHAVPDRTDAWLNVSSPVRDMDVCQSSFSLNSVGTALPEPCSPTCTNKDTALSI
jgi:hypothetical protein